MSTLPRISRTEKLIVAHAALTGFHAAYDVVADSIPRDTPEALLAHDLWEYHPGSPAALAGGTLLAPPPPRSPENELPLREWLGVQAAWYRQHDAEWGELAATAIERIGTSLDFHECNSVGELLARSPWFRLADLDTIETPDRRPQSLLAEILDAEVEGYLRLGGEAARLVAWVLWDLAGEADYFHADTALQFLMAQQERDDKAQEAARQSPRDEEGEEPGYYTGHDHPRMPF